MSKNMAVIDDTGTVLNVILCSDDELETSNLITYTDENPAYIGGTFDGVRFYTPQPYPSWTLDANAQWQAPTAMPVEEGKFFLWNEETLSWDAKVLPTE